MGKYKVNIPLKEFKPNYKYLEVLIKNENSFFIYGIKRYDKVLKKFGDYNVASARDYDDTKTTSVILEELKFYA